MLVALDGNPLIGGHVARGIGRTTRRLLEEFGRFLPSLDPYGSFRLNYYLPGDQTWGHPADWRHIAPRRLAPGEDLLEAAQADGAAVIHLTDYFHPAYEAGRLAAGQVHVPVIVTVRDIIPLHFPAKKQRGFGRLTRALVPILPAVTRIIAISEATKRDLVGTLRVDPDRIDVVYHGVDHDVFHDRYPEDEIENTLSRYGLARPYILYVAAFDSRKNHGLLVDAFQHLSRRGRHKPYLVLVGPGTVPAELTSQIKRLGVSDRVKFAHDVPADDLARMYRGADLFAFPSLYEGFGNPVLEAMACGTPVVALATSSVPEVAGDGAVLVSRNDYGAFGNAMAHVLDNPALAADLRRRGMMRARDFTWWRTARQTLDVYRYAIADAR